MGRVIVVGAGAAGMMAAICAAEAGSHVTLLEAMDRPGKKLLLTGNGKCNLTNLEPLLPERYYGTGAGLAREILCRFTVKDTLEFFRKRGLFVYEKNGYVYPVSGQSASVLEILLSELRRLKVKTKYGEKIQHICRTDGELPAKFWKVQTSAWTYEAEAVILACGSKAAPSTGSDGSGYALAAQAGHRIISPAPALAPVICKGAFLGALAGVRCRAEVSLYRDKSVLIKKDRGELQWTKYGVSGIVVFQLSRFISCSDSGDFFFSINLLPDLDKETLLNVLLQRAKVMGEEKCACLFAGLFHEKLIPVLMNRARISPKAKCAHLSRELLSGFLEYAMDFHLEIVGTRSFDQCQVCAGGVDCHEIDPDTLMSRKAEGLYFAGEILDVDGPCGGYNLQWAWSSGYTAGFHAGGVKL